MHQFLPEEETDPNQTQSSARNDDESMVGRDGERALSEVQDAIKLSPAMMPGYIRCFALVATNRLAEAERVVQEMVEASATMYVKPYFLAMAYVALGNHDGAFEWFEVAFAERDNWLLWFGTEPKLDPIREDPRFMKLFRTMNNPLALKSTPGPLN